MFARLDRIGRFVENFLLLGLLGSIMLLAVSQIIAREFFEYGFDWSGQLIKLMVLWLAMAGAVAACREDRHIRIDAISHLLSPQAIAVTRLIVDLFAAVVCGVLAWHGARWVYEEYVFEDVLVLDIPAWIAHAPVPAAFALMSYRFVIGVAKKAIRLKQGNIEAGS